MYANLAVTVTTRKGKRKTLSAWRVEVLPDGSVAVSIDKNDGGNYYEEGPVKTFPPGTRVEIGADF